MIACGPMDDVRVPHETLLELVRQRRDHQEKLFLQQETRAQFLAGIGFGVAAALVGGFGGRYAELLERAPGVAALSIAAGACFLVFFALVLLLFLPLRSRHVYREGHPVDRAITWAGFRGHPWARYARKPDDVYAFVAAVCVRRVPIVSPEDPGAAAVLRSECYNLWAHWFAAERKSGLLRAATLWMMAGTLLGGFGYLAAAETAPSGGGAGEPAPIVRQEAPAGGAVGAGAGSAAPALPAIRSGPTLQGAPVATPGATDGR